VSTAPTVSPGARAGDEGAGAIGRAPTVSPGARGGDEGAGAIGREPQQDRSRATRLRLLESAIACLAELGYQASTVSVVAEHAGVSRGAAQHHFPTREALFTAALEHVTAVRAEEMKHEFAELPGGRPDTAKVVDVLFALFTGPLFRAALALWVAAANEASLREQIVPLEARMGREMHRIVVGLLGVDERDAGVRETVQATLDLARGLGLANLLTDDSARRAGIAAQWARILDATLH
jgi:AcrR family transcriptional regulator